MEPAPPETPVLIMGHRVAFPAGKKPFPAQLAVMSSVLSALKRQKHALVESPTGSGKTLALLSSCLTFQRDWARQQAAERQQRQQQRSQQQSEAGSSQGQHQSEETTEWDDNAFELLQRSVKRARRDVDERDNPPDEQSQPFSQRQTQLQSQDLFGPNCLEEEPPTIPRIYFCSRTHSQLAQAVKELKSCPDSYMETPVVSPLPGESDLKMCVLGSKRVMCANPLVNDEPTSVNEKCQELRMEKERRMANPEEGEGEGGCPYSQTSFGKLRWKLPQIWDIEDITTTAADCMECPYYFSKSELEKAHIVFCPYNYILDPNISKAVGINLKNAIVVLDEAHNVEDTCRSGASLELTDSILAASIKSFNDVIWQNQHLMIPEAYDAVRSSLSLIREWFSTNSEDVPDPEDPDDDDCHVLWNTPDALDMLRHCSLANVGEADLTEIVQNELMMLNSPGKHVLLTSLALSTATRLISVASYMLRSNGKDADDFKVLITKKLRRNEEGDEIIDTKLCIWCLSAAVVFRDIASEAHSIILASGTLSPMDSFAGELGVDFPFRLEANHVVNMHKQVFVGAVMNGPGRVNMLSKYQNQLNFQYQDSMGQMLLDYAGVIPGGILMFFPSYALMATLTARWKRRGVWEKLEKHKQMFCEPRIGGKEFDALLDEYKSKIAFHAATRDTPSGWIKTERESDADPPHQTGAIFLAVYRGKVSEGIDFSDDNARAVLCVGIPYPNFKDLQVSLKREYQDHKSRVDSKIVNGSLWYKLQAFRALNQALGRCIRHRRDYGAIILIDSRHRGNMHGNSLSKWMRPHVMEFGHSEDCTPLFVDFFQRNRIEMPLPAPEHSNNGSVAPAPGAPDTPIVLKYEETGSAIVESTAPVVSHLGSAAAPIELDIEEADAFAMESRTDNTVVKTEAQARPASVFDATAPAVPAGVNHLGTIDAPIELDMDDSDSIKVEAGGIKREAIAAAAP